MGLFWARRRERRITESRIDLKEFDLARTIEILCHKDIKRIRTQVLERAVEYDISVTHRQAIACFNFDGQIFVICSGWQRDTKTSHRRTGIGQFQQIIGPSSADHGGFAVAAIVLHTDIRVVWRVLDIQADDEFF